MENRYPDAFFISMKGDIKLKERFKIGTVIENGELHYKIFDCKTGMTVHCDIGELNQTIYELMEEE